MDKIVNTNLDKEKTAEMLKPIEDCFNWSMKRYGPTHRAVAWRDAKRQIRRFQIFTGLLHYDTSRNDISINDLGCGYGAMFKSLKDLPQFSDGTYFGYDISDEMLSAARKEVQDPRCIFIKSHVATEKADYSFVSGTYNMRMNSSNEEWLTYVKMNLEQLWTKTRIGLGFNMLNIESPLRDKTLFYADPFDFINFCKNHLSEKVSLSKILNPNEFVIFIRK
jgi:SAM-dependent methyltransferase